MTSTLVYRRPCEHGVTEHRRCFELDCDGSIDTILDPDKVLVFRPEIDGTAWRLDVAVSDVLDVLDREAE